MKLKFIEEKFIKALMAAATIASIGSLLLIIGSVLFKGLPALNLDMITKTPEGGFYLGKAGGVLNAIVGSFYLAGGATLLALIISIPIVLYINVFLYKNHWFSTAIRFIADVMWGIPSIVYGAFGFTLMMFLGLKTSLMAGIIVMTILVLPIMIRISDEIVKAVPQELLDAPLSLGATKWETATKVVLKQTAGGLFTAVLIAFGRAIGDAASVLFTAGYSDSIPTSLNEPAATLPLAIFFQLSTPIKAVRERAYASAFILTIIILLISITIRVISTRLNRHKI